jgi:uncharacterized membrane protein
VTDLFSEDGLRRVVEQLAHLVEAAGAAIVFVGAVLAFGRFVHLLVRRRRTAPFVRIRLDLGRFLVLGLEFQLASDILRTAVAPSFTEIGRLAAVATIRTVLNAILEREIAAERAEIDRGIV